MALSQNLFHVHQQPVVPDHGTQYEENSFSHYGGMHEDELMDWTPFLHHTNFKCRWLLILLPKQQGSAGVETQGC